MNKSKQSKPVEQKVSNSSNGTPLSQGSQFIQDTGPVPSSFLNNMQSSLDDEYAKLNQIDQRHSIKSARNDNHHSSPITKHIIKGVIVSNLSNPPISRITRDNSSGYTNNFQQKSFIDNSNGQISSRSGGDVLEPRQLKLSNGSTNVKPGRAIEPLTAQNMLQIQRSMSKQSLNNNINNNSNFILSSQKLINEKKKSIESIQQQATPTLIKKIKVIRDSSDNSSGSRLSVMSSAKGVTTVVQHQQSIPIQIKNKDSNKMQNNNIHMIQKLMQNKIRLQSDSQDQSIVKQSISSHGLLSPQDQQQLTDTQSNTQMQSQGRVNNNFDSHPNMAASYQFTQRQTASNHNNNQVTSSHVLNGPPQIHQLMERHQPVLDQLQKIISKQPKQKPSNSQQRGTQQPQQIQHKMSQKRIVEEIKSQPKKIDNGPTGPAVTMMNTQTSSSANVLGISGNSMMQVDINNSSLKLANQLPISAHYSNIGRNSSQGVYQNLQMRPVTQGPPSSSQALNMINTCLPNKTFMGGKQVLNTSGGYLQSQIHQNDSRNGLFQGSGIFNQNQTIQQLNPASLNISSQSLERPISSQSNGGRKGQSFLTPQRQLIKQNDAIKGKKLILKPTQIIKNQLSPPSSFVLGTGANSAPGGSVGVSMVNKERVMIDPKTYNDLMNYMIKAECKRLERDQLLNGQQSQSQGQHQFNVNGSLNSKRPNSTLKRLGPIPQIERNSNNPNPARMIYQNQAANAAFFYPQNSNSFNNSSFLSSIHEGRNSKQSKTPQKKQQQIQAHVQAQAGNNHKIKNLYSQAQAALQGKPITALGSQIKRNNYVNELSQAYNQAIGNPGANLQVVQSQPLSQQQFFNLNNMNQQQIPTSKKGAQKKLILQDIMPVQEAMIYQHLTSDGLAQNKALHQQFMMSGKIQPSTASGNGQLIINPQYYYNVADKVQSARGASHNDKEIITGAQKITNLLLQKEQNLKNTLGLGSIESGSSKQAQSHRDNQSTGNNGRSSKLVVGTTNEIASNHLQSQKSNQSTEGTKSKKSSKNTLGTLESRKAAESPSNAILNKAAQKLSSNQRLNIQIDSDLLYGSQDLNAHYNDGQKLEQIYHHQMPISNKATSDSHGFDTFGDSDNRKITAISELQSPDRTNSPANRIGFKPQPNVPKYPKDMKGVYQDVDDIGMNPYGNKTNKSTSNQGLQEFHYSGSFGVPGVFQNQSHSNEALAQSMIQQNPPINNLSFSICNNNISIIAQQEKPSKDMILIQQQNFFNRPLIILDKNTSDTINSRQQSKASHEVIEDHDDQQLSINNNVEYDDEDDLESSGQLRLLSQPFYTYDDQSDEQYYIIDNDSYDQTISIDHHVTDNNGPQPYLDQEVDGNSSTVEAVKQRLINDPQYRRELLERVLPQFAKLNEQFANSFHYKLKDNENPSRQPHLLDKNKHHDHLDESDQAQVVVKTEDPMEDCDIQIGGVTLSNGTPQNQNKIPPVLQGNARATFAILETINRNLNQSKRSNNQPHKLHQQQLYLQSNQSSTRKDEAEAAVAQALMNEEDETNTVIENECDNDYADLYRSFEVEEETEEMRRQKEFQLQKQQLKMQIQQVTTKNTKHAS